MLIVNMERHRCARIRQTSRGHPRPARPEDPRHPRADPRLRHRAAIQQISLAALALNQGTLYPALLRLEQRGWVASRIGEAKGKPRQENSIFRDHRQRPGLRRRGVRAEWSSPTTAGPALASATSRPFFDDVENDRVAGWADTTPWRIGHRPKAAGREHHQETNQRVLALLPEIATSISPAIRVPNQQRPGLRQFARGRCSRRRGRPSRSACCSSWSSSSVFSSLRTSPLVPAVAIPMSLTAGTFARCGCSYSLTTTCRSWR